jgi:hypothetical protein
MEHYGLDKQAARQKFKEIAGIADSPPDELEDNGGIIPLEEEIIPPPFPLEALPNIPRMFAQSIAEAVEVDPVMPALDIFSAFAGVFGGKYQVKPKHGHTEGLNMYTVNIDEPSGRKSPVKKSCSRFLRILRTKSVKRNLQKCQKLKRIFKQQNLFTRGFTKAKTHN